MPDWREQIDIGSERAALPRDAGLPAWTRLRGPNQWPAALPQLRATVTRWQAASMQVVIRILRAFALALGQPADELDQVVRIISVQRLERIRRLPKRQRKGAQYPDDNLHGGGLPSG